MVGAVVAPRSWSRTGLRAVVTEVDVGGPAVVGTEELPQLTAPVAADGE